MKKLLLLFFVLSFYQTKAQTSIFNDLLQKHISKKGIVDYKSFKIDETILDSYLLFLDKICTAPVNYHGIRY